MEGRSQVCTYPTSNVRPTLMIWTARIQLFPRVFALGTKVKPYTTCTVDTSLLFNYNDDLEPPPPDYRPARQDSVRSHGKPYARYLKPLHPGPLHVKVRGKEIVFAAGYVSVLA